MALDLNHENLPVYFQEWKESLNLHVKAGSIAKQDAETQIPVIVCTAGLAVIKLACHFQYGENQDDPKTMLSKIKDHYKSHQASL